MYAILDLYTWLYMTNILRLLPILLLLFIVFGFVLFHFNRLDGLSLMYAEKFKTHVLVGNYVSWLKWIEKISCVLKRSATTVMHGVFYNSLCLSFSMHWTTQHLWTILRVLYQKIQTNTEWWFREYVRLSNVPKTWYSSLNKSSAGFFLLFFFSENLNIKRSLNVPVPKYNKPLNFRDSTNEVTTIGKNHWTLLIFTCFLMPFITNNGHNGFRFYLKQVVWDAIAS